MKALIWIWIFALTVTFSACGPASLEPRKRPSGVPNTAVWAGGADGGCYVQCSVDTERNVNRCKVWNDFTGELEVSGDYRLVNEDRAAKETELKFTGAVNEFIYLAGGKILKRR